MWAAALARIDGEGSTAQPFLAVAEARSLGPEPLPVIVPPALPEFARGTRLLSQHHCGVSGNRVVVAL